MRAKNYFFILLAAIMAVYDLYGLLMGTLSNLQHDRLSVLFVTLAYIGLWPVIMPRIRKITDDFLGKKPLSRQQRRQLARQQKKL